MAQWAVLIPAERFEAERLFHNETLELPETLGTEEGTQPADEPLADSRPGGPASAPRPAPGDEVLVVAHRPEPAVVAMGRISGHPDAAPATGQAVLAVTYTRRFFDDPQPAGGLALDAPVSPVDPARFRALADRVAPAADQRTWLVSVDLPIEADSPAEAVRRFWSYVRDLGPRELPAFVSPTGDELAMQAYVLGEQAHLDPEEDD
jgi:hypothetical protein